MGGAPYIGLRLGGGPIFVISLLYYIAKERPGNIQYHKLPILVPVFYHRSRRAARGVVHLRILILARQDYPGHDTSKLMRITAK